MTTENKIITVERFIRAPSDDIFELIADPAHQPTWDGNDNLAQAEPGQRVRAIGDYFTMTLTNGKLRPNRVVAFTEGREIAWRPAPAGEPEPGHEWRWEVHPVQGGTRVIHTYDWTALIDPKRFDRARATTSANLAASLDRLAVVAEAAPHRGFTS